jgi:hypothetical protein
MVNLPWCRLDFDNFSELAVPIHLQGKIHC